MGLSSISKRWNNGALNHAYEKTKPAHLVYQDNTMWIWSDRSGDTLWFQLEPGDMKTPFNCEHPPMSLYVRYHVRVTDFILPDMPKLRVQLYYNDTDGTVHHELPLSPGALIWFVKTFTMERFDANAEAELRAKTQ